MKKKNFMTKRKGILTEKRLKYIFLFGAFCHIVTYVLDDRTLRGNSSFWLWSIISTVLGLIFLVKELELLKDKTYTTSSRGKLLGVKMLLLILMFFMSGIFFGGILNSIALSTNYFTKDSVIQVDEFEVVKVEKTFSRLKRKSKRRVPRLIIRNEELSKEVELGVNYDDFNKETKRIVIKSRKGMFGWRVIESIEI